MSVWEVFNVGKKTTVTALTVIAVLLAYLTFQASRQRVQHSTAMQVIAVSGSAQLINPKNNLSQSLLVGDLLAVDARLIVNAGAVIDLASPSKDKLRIHGPAKVEIDALTVVEGHTDLRLLAGRLAAFVFSGAKARTFKVRTRAAVAGVRGTVFEVNAAESTTQLAVAKGVVNFTNLNSGKSIDIDDWRTSSILENGFAPKGVLDQIARAELLFVENIPDRFEPSWVELILREFKLQLEQLQYFLTTLGTKSKDLRQTGSGEPTSDFDLDLPTSNSPQFAVDFGIIVRDVIEYKTRTGHLPSRYSQTMESVVNDPFGQPYQFEKTGNSTFKIYSKGPDHRAGTVDDIIYRRTSLDE